jgi:rhodanese-related sulfurtransferase
MRAPDLLQRIQSNDAPLVVDVRSASEFRCGHVPGAINAPVQTILFHLDRLPADKSMELVLTCEHGQRAALAKGILALRGYRNTALLEGHMSGWRQADLPVEK